MTKLFESCGNIDGICNRNDCGPCCKAPDMTDVVNDAPICVKHYEMMQTYQTDDDYYCVSCAHADEAQAERDNYK